MANGSFYKYVAGNKESNYFGLYCEYTFAQNIDGNYTDVKVDVWIRYYSLEVSGNPGTIKVNGTSVAFNSTYINNYPSGGSGKTKLGSATIRVPHNADGSKSGVNISVSWSAVITYANVKYNGFTASTTVNLPTIPRASTITSVSNVVLGNNCSVAFTPASSSFHYQMYFTLGNWSVSTGWISPNDTSLYTYTGLNLSGTLADGSGDTIYAQLPSKTSDAMTVELRTYSSQDTNSYIGTDSKTFTVTVPESVKPTISSSNITLTPQTYGVLIQNKNTLEISVSGCSAGTGSSISSYTYSGPGISTTTPSTSATSSTISNTGELTYTVTVKDSRGRTASATKTIPCYAYIAPSFTSFNAYRVASSSSTTASDDGVYIRYSYGLSYSSVNGSNKITVRLKYKTPNGSWTSVESDITNGTATSGSKIVSKTNGFGTNDTYVVCAEISDSYGGSTSSTNITIFSAERILNIRPNGKGIAFGKIAETDSLFECKWAAKFDDACTIGKSTINKEDTVLTSSNFRCGTCTLSSSDTGISTTFDPAFDTITNKKPTVMLTQLKDGTGIIPVKVTSVDNTGFTAIIDGSAVGSFLFAYLAVYF